MNTIDLENASKQEIQTHIQKLEKIRSDFVSNISHELRTPLTVMIGYLESLAQDTALEKPYQNIMQTMYTHAQRMQHIVEDLLHLSAIEAQEYQEKAFEMVDMHALIKDYLASITPMIEKKQHKIVLNLSSHQKIFGDKKQLVSLIQNLITNAIAYTPEAGTISVSYQEDGNALSFSVEDTGIGIAKEHLARITERFYRIDKHRSRDSGGTGLGLAIIKHIMIVHHGQLKIQSTLGKGSCFRCIFKKEKTIQTDKKMLGS